MSIEFIWIVLVMIILFIWFILVVWLLEDIKNIIKYKKKSD